MIEGYKSDSFSQCCSSYFKHVLVTFYGGPLQSKTLPPSARSYSDPKSESEVAGMPVSPPSQLEWEFLSSQLLFTKPMTTWREEDENEAHVDHTAKYTTILASSDRKCTTIHANSDRFARDTRAQGSVGLD